MTTLEHAQHRRSIRRYTTEAVAEETLQQLLNGVVRAPSAWNLQPWRFVVVQEHDTKQQLQEAAFRQPQVGGSSATIVLYSDMDAALATVDAGSKGDRVRQTFGAMSAEERRHFGLNQSYVALGYLLLLAESMGIASSPMLGFQPEAVRKLLGLPADAPIAALIALGHAAEEGVLSARQPLSALASWR
jgi:nitroreductase